MRKRLSTEESRAHEPRGKSLSLAENLLAHKPPSWIEPLRAIVGDPQVLADPAALWVYCRDRSPQATFQVRQLRVPTTLPGAIVCPGSLRELAAIVRLAQRMQIPLLPFGAGSGVIGGTLPLAGELIVDLKRLNRILALNEIDGTVTVQAGMNGGQLEAQLERRGFTTGHLPQSLHMSTVGGWVACRGAGQSSTRYGKIEDMVLGLEVLLPNGRPLRIRAASRRAVGPSLNDLFVGSEGVFGIITAVTLRIWRTAASRRGVVLGFPSVDSGLNALRVVMQSELRPAVVRLYDEVESGPRTRGLDGFADNPCLAILEFAGPVRLADVERELTLEICHNHGAIVASLSPYRDWLRHRFQSYSARWHAAGDFNDTIEVVAGYRALPGMYREIRDRVRVTAPSAHFGAHWSHFYPDGACQYMTMRLPPMPERQAGIILARLWDLTIGCCHRHGGSMSHHHGIGLLRQRWARAEHGAGLDVLRAIKRTLDPDDLLAPGKLGLGNASGRRRRGQSGE